MSVEINPSNRNAVFSVAIANELGTPVRSGFARKEAVKAALGVPEIIEYRAVVPNERAATLNSDPFELEGLSGSFAIISGLVTLSSDALIRIDDIGFFSIISGSDVIFKSAPISVLDPGGLCFMSSASSQTNIPVRVGRLSLFTTGDSSLRPEGDLIVLLYLIDFSSKI